MNKKELFYYTIKNITKKRTRYNYGVFEIFHIFSLLDFRTLPRVILLHQYSHFSSHLCSLRIVYTYPSLSYNLFYLKYL